MKPEDARLRMSKHSIGVAIVSGLIVVGVVSVLHFVVESWWLSALLIPVLLFGVYQREKLSALWRAALVGLMLGSIAVFGIQSFTAVRAEVAAPPEWDYLTFWLDGQVASKGLDFYQPVNYHQAATGLDVTDDFTKEYLDVGFWYPPPSVWLFVPLGWFDVNTSALLWYSFISLILVVDIALVWRIFLKDQGLFGLGFAAALVFLLRPVHSTFVVGQTNFIVMLVLLALWQTRNTWGEGVFAGIAVCIKPFMVILIAYFLVRRRWGHLLRAVITSGLVALVTLLRFGPTTFFGYITNSPIARLPVNVYREDVNQSLLATILRTTHPDLSHGSPVMTPLFLLTAFIVVVITGGLAFWLDKDYAEIALALLLVGVLLVYPATLEHYATLLIVPILMLWNRRAEIAGDKMTVLVATGIIYLLCSSGDLVFLAIAFTWLLLAGISVWLIFQRAKLPSAVSQTQA